jgi:hypothetical protein
MEASIQEGRDVNKEFNKSTVGADRYCTFQTGRIYCKEP